MAFFPPSSSVTGISRRAAASATVRPTATEPVKLILSTSPRTSAAPVSPSPVATRKTSSGIPASIASCRMSTADSGDSSDGFSTTVFPVTSAAMTTRMGFTIGKFHGEMTPTTPYGSRSTRPFLVTIHDRSERGAMILPTRFA